MADHIFYFITYYEFSRENIKKLVEFISSLPYVEISEGELDCTLTFKDDLDQSSFFEAIKGGFASISWNVCIFHSKEDLKLVDEIFNRKEVIGEEDEEWHIVNEKTLTFDLDFYGNGSIHLYTFYSLEYKPLHLLDKLVEFVTDLYYFLKPLAVIHCAGENYCIALSDLKCFDYKTLKKEGKPKIIGSFNIFSPEIVNNVGRDKFFMLKRIVYKVEELKDGGILLQINRNPVNPFYAELPIKEVMQALGLSLKIFDDILEI